MSASPLAPELPPVVLVTGAAKLTGRDVALLLAAQGWRVAVHYRDSVEEARRTVADCSALTPGAQALRSNLGNETAVRNLLPAVIEAFGQVDAVVHCASTFEHDTAASFSFAAMEKHMRSNAGAAIVLSQALHTHISQRRKSQPEACGVVVNLLDQKLRNQTLDFLSYSLSKAALETANSMLALTLQPLLRVQGVSTAAQAGTALRLPLAAPVPVPVPVPVPAPCAPAELVELVAPPAQAAPGIRHV
jgi:NAD(P)-dependent dehydrogenase (short-subunit alcohol dehydrogenase family)